MKKFKDRIALVTGGNSGIGYATARTLVEKGAQVIITGRRKDAIEKAAEEVGAIPMVADQAVLSDTEILRDMVEKRFGKIDILFINAGIVGTAGPIAGMDAANFDEVMNINFRGAYFMLSKFITLLKDGASVVILSSIVASTHHANSSVYQASKAALNSIAKTAANELAARKIRVNIVSPGPTRTEALRKSGLDQATVEGIFDHLTSISPLKKIGSPEDVASLVTYLCDDASTYITGAEFVIDGGMIL